MGQDGPILGAFRDLEWIAGRLIPLLLIVWALIAYFAIYIVSVLAVWSAINYLVTRHRLRTHSRSFSLVPKEFPKDARPGTFTIRRVRRAAPRSYEPLPLDIVLPDESEIRGFK